MSVGQGEQAKWHLWAYDYRSACRVRGRTDLFALYRKVKICEKNRVNSLANALFDCLLLWKLAQIPTGQNKDALWL